MRNDSVAASLSRSSSSLCLPLFELTYLLREVRADVEASIHPGSPGEQVVVTPSAHDVQPEVRPGMRLLARAHTFGTPRRNSLRVGQEMGEQLTERRSLSVCVRVLRDEERGCKRPLSRTVGSKEVFNDVRPARWRRGRPVGPPPRSAPTQRWPARPPDAAPDRTPRSAR